MAVLMAAQNADYIPVEGMARDWLQARAERVWIASTGCTPTTDTESIIEPPDRGATG